MNLRNIIHKTLLLISLLSTACFSAPVNVDFEVDKLVTQSIEASIVHNYAEAESAAVKIIRLKPNSPEGYFYRAAAIYSMIIDYEEPVRLNDFFLYLDQTENTARKAIAKTPRNPWNYFFLGSAKGYRSSYEMRGEHYFTALNSGLSCINHLKKALEIDSTLYDAYVGLGSYDYWISRKTVFLKYLPLITDQRAKGINELYLALNKGKYSRESAASALAWVLIDAGRDREAVKIVEPYYKKFPASRFFMFSYGRSLFDGKEYAQALKVYYELLKSIQSAPRNNHDNEIGVYYKLAIIYYNLNNYPEALNFCRKGLNLPLTAELRKKKTKVIAELKALEKVCQIRINRKG